jgi:hypothetical protein
MDYDSVGRNGTEWTGRVDPLLTPQSRPQIRVMPENSESACRGFDSRRLHNRSERPYRHATDTAVAEVAAGAESLSYRYSANVVPMPLEPGSIQVRATVTVLFALKTR